MLMLVALLMINVSLVVHDRTVTRSSNTCTMSHPRGGVRRRDDPRLVSGSLFCVKGVAT